MEVEVRVRDSRCVQGEWGSVNGWWGCREGGFCEEVKEVIYYVASYLFTTAVASTVATAAASVSGVGPGRP